MSLTLMRKVTTKSRRKRKCRRNKQFKKKANFNQISKSVHFSWASAEWPTVRPRLCRQSRRRRVTDPSWPCLLLTGLQRPRRSALALRRRQRRAKLAGRMRAGCRFRFLLFFFALFCFSPLFSSARDSATRPERPPGADPSLACPDIAKSATRQSPNRTNRRCANRAVCPCPI